MKILQLLEVLYEKLHYSISQQSASDKKPN